MDSRIVSYANLWDGEHGPTFIADTCRDAHSQQNDISSYDSEAGLNRSFSAVDTESLGSFSRDDVRIRSNDSRRCVIPGTYGAVSNSQKMSSIRMQVIVWSIGSIDVLHGRVTAKFRVSLFWNDVAVDYSNQNGTKSNDRRPKRSSSFQMLGRGRAILDDDTSGGGKCTLDIPPVSILNAESFDVIGRPEVHLLKKDTNLMQWTCLYKASLLQQNMKVDKFPHDQHELHIKIGILTHRKKGQRWDKNVWDLQLATEEDSQDSTRIPYGLIVDHVKIPEFHYDEREGLNFDFVPVRYGYRLNGDDGDKCLEVSLEVFRESGYYDRNVLPLLALLNVVGATVLTMNATLFFQRALLLLNIAFVQVGLRMSLDSKLPSVGYEIKMQRIMNNYFYSLLFLALESSFLYFCLNNEVIVMELADKIDLVSAICTLIHGVSQAIWYYRIFEVKR